MSNSKLSFCHMFFSANTQVPDEGLAHRSYLIKCAVKEVKWPIPQLSQHAISSPLYFRVLPFPSCQWHRIYFPCSPLHPTLWSLAPLSSASHLYHILHIPHFGNACFLSLKFEATKLHSNVAHLRNTNAFSFFFSLWTSQIFIWFLGIYMLIDEEDLPTKASNGENFLNF